MPQNSAARGSLSRIVVNQGSVCRVLGAALAHGIEAAHRHGGQRHSVHTVHGQRHSVHTIYRRAPLYVSSSRSINAILPSALPRRVRLARREIEWRLGPPGADPGDEVAIRGIYSEPAWLWAAASSSSIAPAVCSMADSSAAPGQAVVLWGTGLGPLPSVKMLKHRESLILSSDVRYFSWPALWSSHSTPDGHRNFPVGPDQFLSARHRSCRLLCAVTVSVSGTAQFGIFILGEGPI